MKTINVSFEDEEHELLIFDKGNATWHDYILKDMKGGKKNGKNNNTKTR